MRTPEVEAAMRNVDMEHYQPGDARKLAAEVERLEAELAPYRDTSKGIGGYIDATVTSELNAKQRAEAAEADSARHKRNEELQMTRAIKAEARAKELEAQSARLRAALESLQSDAQCTIDLYNKIGPTWTSRDSGAEYYDASYVIGSAEERIATIKAALKESEMCLKETKQLREQNAKLRAALEVELAENQVLKFGTPTGAFEIFATKQSWRLKAALNGEEAST